MDIEPGTIIANRYRVQKPLGRGGMGEVFAAENVRTGRTVAVKLLRADTKQKSSAVARFRREARAAGAIHSDYVTQVLDVEEDPDHGIVIVFELLEGESLIDRLKRTGPMTFDDIFPIVEQVWIGLADAHNSGVIHRDLKPSNVFLERRPDSSHRVKILDFGISKLTREVGSETLTEMGQNLGTFSFMPPEQIGKAKTVDHRADIYSAATLIYQAMSGQLPYAARNILMIVELKTKAEPRKLGDVMDTPVDPRLEAFLAKALKREPAERFQSALEALEAWRALRSPGGSAVPHDSRGSSPAQGIPQPAPSSPQRNYAATQPANPPSMAGTPAPSMAASQQGYPAQQQRSYSSPNLPAQGGQAMRSQSQSGMQAVRDPAATTPAVPSRMGGTVAINEAALRPSGPNVPSVADSTSDHGSDHVATVAIPMRHVADALAARGIAAGQQQPFNPSASYSTASAGPAYPHSSTPHPGQSMAGVGLPKLHDDRPHLGTQLLPSRPGGPSSNQPSSNQPSSNQPSSNQSSSNQALGVSFQGQPSYAGGTPGSGPGIRQAGTIAMNNFLASNTQGSGAYPAAGGASGAYPAGSASGQGVPLGTLPSAVPAQPNPQGQSMQGQQPQQLSNRQSGAHERGSLPSVNAGAGQTARHVPVKTADEVPAAQDLQTAVYRRSNDAAAGRDAPPPTIANPAPRSKAWVILGMIGLLVLGFVIVTLVVTLVTKKFPFAP